MDLTAFKGIYSATFTPYDKQGAIDLDMQAKLIEFHVRNGLTGLYLCGSTGEGPMLDIAQRKELTRNAVRVANGRLKVIAHVGHICTDAAVELARDAEEHGADAISSINPIYYSYTDDIECRHYSGIADSVSLPVLIYANPLMTGKQTSDEQLFCIFAIENVVGMKYTGTDFYAMRNVSDRIQKPHVILSGSDERMAMGLVFGTQGAIGTHQNIIPGAFVKLYQLFKQERLQEVMALQQQINQLVIHLLSWRDLSIFKAAMRYVGFDCGWAKRPFAQLSEAEYRDLAKTLERFDELFAMSNR